MSNPAKELADQPGVNSADRPDISFILIQSGNEGCAACLESLLALEDGNLDIVLIADEQSAFSPGKYPNASNLSIIYAPTDISQWQARKLGVKAAKGRYLIFPAGDAVFTSECLKIIKKEAADNYDIVAFEPELKSIEAESKSDDSAKPAARKYPARIFRGHEILEAIYEKKDVAPTLTNKLLNAQGWVAAWEETDKYNPDAGEALACVAAIARAKSMRVVKLALPGEASHENMSMDPGRRWQILKDYLAWAGLNNYRNSLMALAMAEHVKGWLTLKRPEEITATFNAMAACYGINNLIAFIAAIYRSDWQRVADVFQHYLPEEQGRNNKATGILLEEFGSGGTERVTLDLARVLTEEGIEVTMFLKRPNANDHKIPSAIRTEYIPLNICEGSQVMAHISALDAVLARNRPGAMFMPSTWSHLSFWEIMLLKYRGIGVITHNHMPFTDPLLSNAPAYTLTNHAATLRCADKHICLSRHSETYCRLMGVDARYIANPIEEAQSEHAGYYKAKNNIVVFGRLGDRVKRVRDALEVIAKIAKTNRSIKATFIGPLKTREESKQFYDKAYALGILDNVKVTGWISDPEPYLKEAGVLLCTSHEEAFPLSICEAQALGVPCVMYNLPIMAAEENEGIIQVPHGDNIAAAGEIERLLADETEWKSRSAAARKKMREFSPARFKESILGLLQSYKSLSPYRALKQDEYGTIFWALGFYNEGYEWATL